MVKIRLEAIMRSITSGGWVKENMVFLGKTHTGFSHERSNRTFFFMMGDELT